MSHDFDTIIDRRHSDSVKWNRYDGDVIPMWIADMDFHSPEPVIQAIRERVEHGVFGYGVDPSALRQVIVERLQRLYGWTVLPETIVFLTGVVRGFNLLCRVAAQPSEAVLVQPPVYYPILYAPKNAGLQRQDMELTRNPDGSYEVDWQAMEASITPETRLFILCNPHNPVGKVFRRSDLEQMAEICLRHRILICSDEVHCDLIYSGHQHVPIASLDAEIAQNTITLMAPSKTFNLPGLQCSIAIIPNRELRQRYLEAKKGLVPHVNIMGLVAAQAAYRDGQEWLQQLLSYLESNRDYLVDYIGQRLPTIHVAKPEGTYLAWLDCRSAGIEGNPGQFFLERGRVAFNEGAMFGKGGEGFVRLNFGCPRATLTQALERMQVALESQNVQTT